MKRKTAVAACCCVALVAAGIAVALWHPWEMGTQSVVDGQQVVDDAAQTTDDGQSEASGGDGWSALGWVDEGDVPTRPEGWMGPEDESLEYYQREIVTDENGNERAKGLLSVCFEKEVGEERMREIVRELGCRWVGGIMYDSPYIDDVSVDVLVPDGASEKEYAALFETYDEVVYAWPYTVAGTLT